MVVKAIAGLFLVLVAVALLIPSFWGYRSRSLVNEVVAAAGDCKRKVDDHYGRRNAFPRDAREAGCSAGGSDRVAEVRVSGGRVEAVIRDIRPEIDGRAVVLEATKDEAGTQRAAPGGPIRGWRCSTTAGAANFKYFPASCRQDPLPP
jgi:type IV pilus assembly protein PilA